MHPAEPAVGRAAQGQQEFLRFRANPSLSFPPAQIRDLFLAATPRGVGAPPAPPAVLTMVVNFMGLFGPQGALPQYYTELIAQSRPPQTTVPAGDGPRHVTLDPVPLRDFLDIFNHRFISLFYRAWEKYQFALAFERHGVREPGDQGLPGYVRSLVGVGSGSLNDDAGLRDLVLFYGGLLSARPRSVVALEGILEDHFGIPIQVRQFQGQWFRLEAENRTRLRDGCRNELGVSAGLWERYWDPQVRFRLRLGPLTWTQFRSFLPDGKAHAPLLTLTRFVAGEDFTFDVQLVLRRQEVPACRLGSRATRLGWSTWLRTAGRPPARDPEDAVLPDRHFRAGSGASGRSREDTAA